jgi:hypothetical protein
MIRQLARAAKKGMWRSRTKLESPAEYKKRYAGASFGTVKAQEKAKGIGSIQKLLRWGSSR